ncbi:MAG: hypothetical protein ACOY3Y_01355, partial [Acidobacteriota bacterium]
VPMRGRGLVAVRGRARHRRGCRFVHFLAAKGITSGCGGGNYCPTSPLGRDQMAVFLTKAFDLALW